jgi:precorrin-6B methylase 2
MSDPPPIREIRQRIIPRAHGTVLEVGSGSGANFLHYDPVRVNKLYALELNAGMIRLAERERRRTKLDVQFLDLPRGTHSAK